MKEQVQSIHAKDLLPDGLRIVPFYDRIELITAALKTIYKALLEGVVCVIVVLFLFSGRCEARSRWPPCSWWRRW